MAPAGELGRWTANKAPVMHAQMNGPYTHADFARMALAEFPELREEFEEYADLLHLQMHAFQRLVERAEREGDWATYARAMRLADELWRRPDDALLNALNVSFLEHLAFVGVQGEQAWGYMTPALREGWRAMQAYMARLAALAAPPRKQRPPKPRRRRR
jgi:hypothetical protein